MRINPQNMSMSGGRFGEHGRTPAETGRKHLRTSKITSNPKRMRRRKYFHLRAESEGLWVAALKTGLGRHVIELRHERNHQ